MNKLLIIFLLLTTLLPAQTSTVEYTLQPDNYSKEIRRLESQGE